jgi:hypothetical protein
MKNQLSISERALAIIFLFKRKKNNSGVFIAKITERKNLGNGLINKRLREISLVK